MSKLILTGFAAGRHTPTSGRSYFKGSVNELLRLVRASWGNRKPGQGRDNLTEVVVVPVPTPMAQAMFHCNTVRVQPDRYHTKLKAMTDRREHPENPEVKEEPFIKVVAEVGSITVPPEFAWVVCYHHDILEPAEREGKDFVEGDFGGDWYIVSIGASAVEDEPMHPVTMARNQLRKTGGTYVEYTPDQWAKSVDYWKDRCQMEVPNV